jgi:hypothetical protein
MQQFSAPGGHCPWNRACILLRAIYPAFQLLFPNQLIRADDLARAMVDVAVQGTDRGGRVFENRDIRTMIKLVHTSIG